MVDDMYDNAWLVKFCPLDSIMKLCTAYFVAKKDSTVTDGIQHLDTNDDDDDDDNNKIEGVMKQRHMMIRMRKWLTISSKQL
eukprot:8860021-Ditylum_brightwellii.AAC.1